MRPDFDIYLITDRTNTGGRDLKEIISEAVGVGIRGIQLREKGLPTRELLRLAGELREITCKAEARLLINERVDICLAVGADGVHIGMDSIPPNVARNILGEEKIIGVSTHSIEEARIAERQGADFITLGPIYYTGSKAQYGRPLGTEIIKIVSEGIKIPIFAIGGIKIDNIELVLKAGAHGIAMISAIMSSRDIPYSAQRFVAKVKSFKENQYDQD